MHRLLGSQEAAEDAPRVEPCLTGFGVQSLPLGRGRSQSNEKLSLDALQRRPGGTWELAASPHKLLTLWDRGKDFG